MIDWIRDFRMLVILQFFRVTTLHRYGKSRIFDISELRAQSFGSANAWASVKGGGLSL